MLLSILRQSCQWDSFKVKFRPEFGWDEEYHLPNNVSSAAVSFCGIWLFSFFNVKAGKSLILLMQWQWRPLKTAVKLRWITFLEKKHIIKYLTAFVYYLLNTSSTCSARVTVESVQSWVSSLLNVSHIGSEKITLLRRIFMGDRATLVITVWCLVLLLPALARWGEWS